MKYFLGYIPPLAVLVGLIFKGYWSYFAIAITFLLVPLAEAILGEDTRNLNEETEEIKIKSPLYDFLLYLLVPIHYGILFSFLWTIAHAELSTFETIGLTLSMGMECGVIGINVAHELGHRKNKWDRFLAKSLLLTSLYMHFIVEHNRGHHTYVGTAGDPATARRNEPIYIFWFRSIAMSFVSAWKIEKMLMQRKNLLILSLKNEMIRLVLIETLFCSSIYFLLGTKALIGFFTIAALGILLLETVNYIEHYGLLRKETSPGKYERVQPWHSWNSNYKIGRIVLFELTRHSDHHYMSSRKYQFLRHIPESPQLPAGYPASILLTLVPPLWFRVMNPKIDALKKQIG